MAVLTVTDITQEAKTYQKQLRFLPYSILAEELSGMGIQLMQVAGKDIITEAHRKGGLLRPYDPNNVNDATELMKFVESTLEVKKSYISIDDSILNYGAKKLMNNPMPGTGINKTKKHPFEDLITSGIVKTATEDVLDALFSAEYSTLDQTPQGCFDGYDTIIDGKITATEISVANKNMVNTGLITAPVSDTDYDAVMKLVEFVRSANKFLKRNGILYLTKTVYLHAVDALENKFKYKDWDLNGVQRYINEKAGSNVILKPNDLMGTGDRIILTVPANLHFGMDTFGDYDFVQVRAPYKDPNIVNFWLQADFGTRIQSIHYKNFQINEGTPVHTTSSGDY